MGFLVLKELLCYLLCVRRAQKKLGEELENSN